MYSTLYRVVPYSKCTYYATRYILPCTYCECLLEMYRVIGFTNRMYSVYTHTALIEIPGGHVLHIYIVSGVFYCCLNC